MASRSPSHPKPPRAPSALTRRLARAPRPLFVLFGALAAFSTYASMQAFRKPFQAMEWEGARLWGLEPKTALVIAQVLGYGLAKVLGVKLCSELERARRLRFLLGAILAAEAALLLFAWVPPGLRPLALFLNGLPLGLVWGVCVLYVEGRRATELLFVGLATSHVIASGVVKDAGLFLVREAGIAPSWMPAVTGLLFLPPLLLSAWLLDQLPAPDAEDARARAARRPMKGAERRWFLRRFWPGIAVTVLFYLALTGLRDLRDSYGIEIWRALGLEGEAAIFTRSELLVAAGTACTLVLLRLLDSRRFGVVPNLLLVLAGMALVGGGTLLQEAGAIGGFSWMVLVGLGVYFAYVSCDTIFFERFIASSARAATAVFMAYVMDAAGYTGTVGLLLVKNLAAPELDHLAFFRAACLAVAALGSASAILGLFYFPRAARREREAGRGS